MAVHPPSSKSVRAGVRVPPERPSLRSPPAGGRERAPRLSTPAASDLRPSAGITGAWSAVTVPVQATSTMLLLNDGRLMCQESNAPGWWACTPDGKGAYASGTWAALAPMSKGRMYYGSLVLKDGRVLVAGGEYTGGNAQTEDNTLEIYEPKTNTWKLINGPGWAMVGDAPMVELPDGRVLMGSIDDTKTAILDPTTGNWSDGGTKNGISDEESWVLLKDGSVLTVNCHTDRQGKAELWVPQPGGSGAWLDAGQLTVAVVDAASEEIGAGLQLEDGRVIFLGATGHTVLYTPAAQPLQVGTWAAGPDLPKDATGAQVVCKDAPAALLPGGHLLVTGSSPGTSGWGGPTLFFDLDPVAMTFSSLAAPANNGGPPYNGRLMLCPSGELAYAQGTNQLAFLPPQGGAPAKAVPVITSAPASVTPNGTLEVQGTGFNGITQAVAYGDDASSPTNYPLARLRAANGDVVYLSAHDPSTMGVDTGQAPVSTQVTVPAGVVPGNYQLEIVANAVPSSAVPLVVTAANSAIKAVRTQGAQAAAYLDALAAAPNQHRLSLDMQVQDAAVRQAHPGFDGLERAFALVPTPGAAGLSWVRQELTYADSADGSDFHHAAVTVDDAGLQALRQNGVAFGMDINADGPQTVWLQQPGQNAPLS